MVREGWKLNKNQEIWKKNTLAASGVEMEGLLSFVVLEASVISTEIGPFWGSVDEGLVGADLNAWDSSSVPRADWDAMADNCEERNRIRNWISFWEEDELFYLSSWWSCSTKSFPSNGFLGCPLGYLAFWRLICYNCRSSLGFHQPLQYRCSWSQSWNWTWRIILYGMPFSVHNWGIEFSILQGCPIR